MELPHLGEHCDVKTCNRLDFLPIKCDACEKMFCGDHMSYANHNCPSAHKKDVQVPVCPMCNAPVPSKRGDPPDYAVSMHLDNECGSGYKDRRRRIFTNKCSKKGCKVKELIPVLCKDCSYNYCLGHRHPTDHSCIGRDQAMREKRLEALERMELNKRRNGNKNTKDLLRGVQGTLNEDEAFAAALQASINEQEGRPAECSAWKNQNKCQLS
ncbi:unnamed protein product [Trichogramma brassicae]|uniref:AN1-type domain-containing protein n=1 Tax=Trichogramma brassicae TaxID=86971 RepID=A0A6H5I8E3_9HYME|nr:unnamed protein product [Trichogramma brassicae]